MLLLDHLARFASLFRVASFYLTNPSLPKNHVHSLRFDNLFRPVVVTFGMTELRGTDSHAHGTTAGTAVTSLLPVEATRLMVTFGPKSAVSVYEKLLNVETTCTVP